MDSLSCLMDVTVVREPTRRTSGHLLWANTVDFLPKSRALVMITLVLLVQSVEQVEQHRIAGLAVGGRYPGSSNTMAGVYTLPIGDTVIGRWPAQ